MSASRRRKSRKAEPAEFHNDERWMASYMDMVTVLMCMFIVLFAMSSVDADKFEQLRNSLATGFGQVEQGKVDTAEGVVVPDELVGDEGELSDLELAQKELSNLTSMRDAIDSGLKKIGLDKSVSYTIDERGLTVGLIGAGTFFGTNSSVLSTDSQRILSVVGGVIKPTKNEVSVEGHTDSRPANAPYETNWELSGDRATKVVRYFAEKSGIPSSRLGATGYGQARPQSKETSAAAMANNRRVDVVILSDKPETVRALIPGLAKAVAENG